MDKVSHAGVVHHAVRQCRGGATLRGGSFDRSGASPRLHEEWRKHHEAELSSADRIQDVHGTHTRQPNCQESILGPHNGGVPGGIGRAQRTKASSMMLILFMLSHRHAAPLKSPAIKSTFSKASLTALLVRTSFFPMPRFLAETLMCNDKTVNVFWPLRGCRRKEAHDSTPCKTQPESPSITFFRQFAAGILEVHGFETPTSGKRYPFMTVDRSDIDVGVESVLVEENCTNLRNGSPGSDS